MVDGLASSPEDWCFQAVFICNAFVIADSEIALVVVVIRLFLYIRLWSILTLLVCSWDDSVVSEIPTGQLAVVFVFWWGVGSVVLGEM